MGATPDLEVEKKEESKELILSKDDTTILKKYMEYEWAYLFRMTINCNYTSILDLYLDSHDDYLCQMAVYDKKNFNMLMSYLKKNYKIGYIFQGNNNKILLVIITKLFGDTIDNKNKKWKLIKYFFETFRKHTLVSTKTLIHIFYIYTQTLKGLNKTKINFELMIYYILIIFNIINKYYDVSYTNEFLQQEDINEIYSDLRTKKVYVFQKNEKEIIQLELKILTFIGYIVPVTHDRIKDILERIDNLIETYKIVVK